DDLPLQAAPHSWLSLSTPHQRRGRAVSRCPHRKYHYRSAAYGPSDLLSLRMQDNGTMLPAASEFRAPCTASACITRKCCRVLSGAVRAPALSAWPPEAALTKPACPKTSTFDCVDQYDFDCILEGNIGQYVAPLIDNHEPPSRSLPGLSRRGR